MTEEVELGTVASAVSGGMLLLGLLGFDVFIWGAAIVTWRLVL